MSGKQGHQSIPYLLSGHTIHSPMKPNSQKFENLTNKPPFVSHSCLINTFLVWPFSKALRPNIVGNAGSLNGSKIYVYGLHRHLLKSSELLWENIKNQISDRAFNNLHKTLNERTFLDTNLFFQAVEIYWLVEWLLRFTEAGSNCTERKKENLTKDISFSINASSPMVNKYLSPKTQAKILSLTDQLLLLLPILSDRLYTGGCNAAHHRWSLVINQILTYGSRGSFVLWNHKLLLVSNCIVPKVPLAKHMSRSV